MNVSHKHRFVFLGNPRTGSRVSFQALRRYGLRGDDARPETLTHRIGIPDGAEDYLLVATVRHPGSRLVSLWQWWKSLLAKWAPGPLCDFLRENPDDFSGFVLKASESWPHALQPQVLRLTSVRAPDFVIRFEHAQEDYARLPFVEPGDRLALLPSNPVTTNWRDLYTLEALGIMQEIYLADFAQLGYSPDG